MSLRAHILKEQARQAMKQASTPPTLVTLAFILLTTVLVEVVYSFIPSNGGVISLFLSIVLTLYQHVMDFGYASWSLDVADEQDGGIPSLLDGFGLVGRVLLMKLHVLLGVFARSILLLLSYMMIIFSVASLSSEVVGTALALAVTLVLFIALAFLTLRYSLAPFVLSDYPEGGSLIAVHRSLELTQRHTWALFKLYLSFWPWYLLQAVITLVVGIFTMGSAFSALPELYATADPDTFTIAVSTAVNGLLTSTLASMLLLPIQLLLKPYQNIALASFYRALSPLPAQQSFAGSQL